MTKHRQKIKGDVGPGAAIGEGQVEAGNIAGGNISISNNALALVAVVAIVVFAVVIVFILLRSDISSQNTATTSNTTPTTTQSPSVSPTKVQAPIEAITRSPDSNPPTEAASLALPTATLLPTTTPSLTTAQTPTKTYTPSHGGSPTAEASLALPIATRQPTIFVLSLLRRGDTLAVCADQAVNLSTLQLELSLNEKYRLGDLFPASEQTNAGECWCLEPDRAAFDTPEGCANTATIEYTNHNEWRNTSITILFEGFVETCEPQQDERSTYICAYPLTLP
jgi:hypothetical protein